MGTERQLKSLLWRALLLPFLAMIGAAVLLSWASARVLNHAELVRHTDEVISHANRALKLGVDMESGVRGYQITGDRALLAPYESGARQIEAEFDTVQALILVDPQREKLAAIRAAHRAWAEFSTELVRRRETGGDYASSAINRVGKQLFDAFRARFQEFMVGEEELKQERTQRFVATNRRVLAARLILLLGLGAALGWFTRRQLREVAVMFRHSEAAALREAEHARQSAAELRRSQVELERRVAERTHELQLALEKAQEVDRLKSEFLATMSHELRTPLNSIIGFTEIVVAGLPGELNAEQEKQLRYVLGSANHLLHLINDLLDLARIESGRVEPAWEVFPPAEVVQEALETVRPLAERKGLALVADVRLPPALEADRKMFLQVLLNLLGNAIKFTSRGEVRLTSHVAGTELVTSVTDTGIGIKADQLPLLFEAFRQVDGSARRRYEGTGLGLYLCKRIVGLLHGTIRAASEFGRGSTFTFTLPRAP